MKIQGTKTDKVADLKSKREQEYSLTLERVDDGEKIHGHQLEGPRSERKEDQPPRDTQDTAQAQEHHHISPVMLSMSQLENLIHHGGQHDAVEEKHQA